MTKKKVVSKSLSKKSASVKKTVAKKAVVKKALPATLPFTKKNVLAFADMIFSDKGGEIRALRLCDGNLLQTNGTKRVHCAVGEAFHTFVSPDLKKLKALLKDDGGPDFESPTDAVIDQLVKVAKLSNPKNASALVSALDRAVSTNDGTTVPVTSDSGTCPVDTLEYVVRAKEVADVFRHKVAPLLK